MLGWFDSTATLLILRERDGMVDMSGLDCGDVLVVWVQVPPLVYDKFVEFTLAKFFLF